jgi:hypothetical protein
MNKYSSSKDVNQMIKNLLKSGWQFKKGKCHGAIISPRGQRITFSSTPSDYRVFKKFRAQIRNEMKEIENYAV